MTDRLYEKDGTMLDFEARVLSCESRGDRWAVILDRTSFFPGGGGQEPDSGCLGSCRVVTCAEEEGEVVHITDAPLKEGAAVSGSPDKEIRFRRMQDHTGEHILSGTAHRLFGCDNVGFHMDPGLVTVDLSAVLDAGDVERLETQANLAVLDDVPITCLFPSTEELDGIQYRSKGELKGQVRLVRIEGVDLCACCAPHLVRSGQVGLIKIMSFEKHRGGTRLTAAAGLDALDDFREKSRSVLEISNLLSAKKEMVAPAVKNLQEGCEGLRRENAELRRRLLGYRICQLRPCGGNMVLFEDALDDEGLRELVNAGAEKCGGFCAVFTPDGTGGYRYAAGSRNMDMKKLASSFNLAVGGRGGGSSLMIRGACTASREEIEKAFSKPDGSE